MSTSTLAAPAAVSPDQQRARARIVDRLAARVEADREPRPLYLGGGPWPLAEQRAQRKRAAHLAALRERWGL